MLPAFVVSGASCAGLSTHTSRPWDQSSCTTPMRLSTFTPRHDNGAVAKKVQIFSNLSSTYSRHTTREVSMKAPTGGEKINVGVLGATGSVGQRFMQLLDNHPWFRVTALGASPRSAGKRYDEAVNWKQAVPIPSDMASIVVSECDPSLPGFEDVQVVFSGMDNNYAGEVEEKFAAAGKAVFSNAKNHRMDDDVPILIPPVNIQHLDIIPKQRRNRGYSSGFIITNANCSTTAMSIGIKPVADAFGIDTIIVSTMQAISGAGYPGLSSMDILDNVVPLIGGEEPKMESESRKILGSVSDDGFQYADFNVSAMCNRVHVLDGHTECLSIKFQKPASPVDIIRAIHEYPSVTKDLGLPSAPDHDIVFNPAPDRPQPRLDRMAGNGYTVTVGRVRECNVFDARMVLFGHNTIVGAAGGSLLNAELCVVRDLIN